MGPAEEVDVSEVRARVGGHLCGRKPHGRHVEHRVLVPDERDDKNIRPISLYISMY